MKEIFRELLEAYGLAPGATEIRPLGKGHIHDTYHVDRSNDNAPPLILQRINNTVFKDVDLLMHNLELVSSHLAYKNRKAGFDPAKKGILLLEAEEGKSWIGNAESGLWRMFWYIQDQVSYDIAGNPEIAFQGGKAIAHFQSMLLDLPPEKIGDTIPGFHDLRIRIGQFEDAIKSAPKTRIELSEDLIRFSRDNYQEMTGLYNRSEKTNIPVRITHNDTKFNNILFSKSGEATCMIDLDTVMKGYSWFDFGDAMRTGACTSDEDEPDMEKIGFRMDIFEGFAKGYISEAASFLTAEEIGILHRAPALFAFMQGLRFLTDFLNSDVYYKTSKPEGNLIRAKGQYTLVQRIRENEDKMAEIIKMAVRFYS